MSPLTIGPISQERTLRLVAVVVAGILMSGYVLFQARNLIQGPTIVLHDTPTTLIEGNSREISGRAQNVVLLRVNGREIHTDESGNFSHTLTLEQGYTIMTLEAFDRYGRKTIVERGFVRDQSAKT